MNSPPPSPSVTLDNCADEPIHIPGHIQPHGALLAFSASGQLSYGSANAAELLGEEMPALGETPDSRNFGIQNILKFLDSDGISALAAEGSLPEHAEIKLNGKDFDLIVHRSGDVLVAEFEIQPEGAHSRAGFAIRAHRGMDKLRRQSSIQALLEVAVDEVRRLTGFDRVMAYRFGHDGSGDVVAEARRDDLTSFLNQRYPASDIPAQARRLYIISTLRLIADIAAVPVPVHGLAEAPLDMSHCVLRSVSPVHIEYLTNMGVRASMSVSIVINGQLWGLLACHHRTPRLVPYETRMACDVMAQILAANVQALTAAEHTRRLSSAATLRSTLTTRMLRSDESSRALVAMAPALVATFDAHAAIILEDGRLAVHGDIGQDAARSLVAWLCSQPRHGDGYVVSRNSLVDLPQPLAQKLGPWCGFLASCFDEFLDGWLVLLRKEEVQTIAWGHRPEKIMTAGPLGMRLTPQSSFEVWTETAKGIAVPWNAGDLEIARGLFDELARAASLRHAQLSKAKDLMMAVLSHDLRTPLQTINMAAHVIGKTANNNEQMSQRIRSSSNRMERMISQALDLSRLQHGMGLHFNAALTDVRQLTDAAIAEMAVAHPTTVFSKTLALEVTLHTDPDRLSQLLSNLLSNAHHHSGASGVVHTVLRVQDEKLQIEVRNAAPPIPAEIVDYLFVPFKRHDSNNPRNTGGMGLGLYIAHEIARGQGGSLAYTYDMAQGQVVFQVEFPR